MNCAFQRTSVVVRVREQSYMSVYTKGAPEVVQQLCIKDTVPKDFRVQLAAFTKKGYRVYAVATKTLQLDLKAGEVSPIEEEEPFRLNMYH